MAGVTVSRAGDRLIAVKQVPAAQSPNIEREAETLRRLDHPGVVRFVDLIETPDDGKALHTEFVSSDTWATRPATDPTGRAAGVAALAEVVADLHDMGFAHCRINPTHVLHGDGDRPVLCGFRQAAEADPENRRVDLVALADLCHDPALEPGPLVHKLSALADAARAGRLDIRELARRLAEVTDKRSAAAEPDRATADARSSRNSRGAGSGHGGRPRRRSLVVLAVVLCGSAAVLAAAIRYLAQPASTPVTITAGAGSLSTDPGAHAGPANQTGSAPAPPAAPDPPGGAAAATGPGQTAFPSPMIPGAPVPGSAAGSSPLALNPDSSPGSAPSGSLPAPAPPSPATGRFEDPASLQPGAVLEHAGSLYGVGRLGDFVETGDWDCDGEPTPAIVRPSTGDVVLFHGWPAPGQSIAMPVRWAVDAPTGAEVVAHGSCHLLRVYTSAGSRLFDPMEG